MNTKLRHALEIAIDQVIETHAEDDLWDGYVATGLTTMMAIAAETVFDAAMDAQEFAKEQQP